MESSNDFSPSSTRETETPHWLKPLNGGTWLQQDAKQQPHDPEKMNAKIAKAKDLAKIYQRSKVADIMGVSRATIFRWLGPKR